jgi:hypothetical protein
MKLVTVYHKPNSPEFQMHKYKQSNGSIRYYQIDGWLKNPRKFPIKKDAGDYWVEEKIYVTRDELGQRELRSLEMTEAIIKKKGH